MEKEPNRLPEESNQTTEDRGIIIAEGLGVLADYPEDLLKELDNMKPKDFEEAVRAIVEKPGLRAEDLGC